VLVRARLADNRWRFADKVIVDFVDRIEGAPAVALESLNIGTATP
jgi:hypothetical protein